MGEYSDITGSMLAERFRVKPEDGEILRRTRGGNYVPAGYIKPGSSSTGGGYHIVSFRNAGSSRDRRIRAHQLMWAWEHGKCPSGKIDHINGDRSDNRISNLRAASSSQNKLNKTAQSNNKSGLKWVYKQSPNRWRADVAYRENGIKKRYRAYGFITPDAAFAAASDFAKSAHGTFYNPGKVEE